MNCVEINGEVFKKGYHSEDLPFTGNGFAGGVDTDCIIPEFEFLKTADNGYIIIKMYSEVLMIEKEIKIILEKFMNCFSDRVLIKKLIDLITIKGFGTECYGCMTSEGLELEDEDFFGFNCVKITICPPASLNEVIVIVTNQVFFDALKNRIESYIKKNPFDKKRALQYMEIIKKNFSAD